MFAFRGITRVYKSNKWRLMAVQVINYTVAVPRIAPDTTPYLSFILFKWWIAKSCRTWRTLGFTTYSYLLGAGSMKEFFATFILYRGPSNAIFGCCDDSVNYYYFLLDAPCVVFIIRECYYVLFDLRLLKKQVQRSLFIVYCM